MKKMIIGLVLLLSISVFASETIDVPQIVNSPVADINGSIGLEVNGSITPVSFIAKPIAGKSWWIGNIVGYMEGQTQFSSELFGNLPALTNGMIIKINNIAVATIKTNRDLVLMMDIQNTPTALAKTDRSFTGRWDLSQSFGKPVLVNSSGIEFLIQDDLSSLVDFHINVQGLER